MDPVEKKKNQLYKEAELAMANQSLKELFI